MSKSPGSVDADEVGTVSRAEADSGAGTGATTSTGIAGILRPQLVALVVLFGTLVLLAGPAGIAIWLLTVLALLVLDTPFAVATGLVALAATPSVSFAGTLQPELGWLAPLSYLFLAATDVADTAHPQTAAVTTVVAGTLLGGTGWIVLAGTDRPTWTAALTVSALVALASYGLVVYARVAFESGEQRERAADDSEPAGRSSGDVRADGGIDPRERYDGQHQRQHRQSQHPHQHRRHQRQHRHQHHRSTTTTRGPHTRQ